MNLLLFLALLTAQPPLCDHVMAHQAELEARNSYAYPFCPLVVPSMDEVTLFSYGSLMNHRSASRTLSPETLRTRRPAIAFGIQRIYNRDVATSSRYEQPTPNTRAMLNVKKVDEPCAMVNGVVVDMKREDLLDFCKREIGYDLIPVLVTDWENEGSTFYIAYCLSASDEARHGKHYTAKEIVPYPGYQETVQKGAASYGDAFLKMYLKTTYLADGETLVKRATSSPFQASRPFLPYRACLPCRP